MDAMTIRSASALKMSVGLFLAYGAIYVLVGALTPFALMFMKEESKGLWVSHTADTIVYGATPQALVAREPAIGKLRDSILIGLAALMCAAGVLIMSVAWFALRRGEVWALGALAAAGCVVLPFYVLIFVPYVRAGAPIGIGHMQPFIMIPGILLIPGVILGWLGLR